MKKVILSTAILTLTLLAGCGKSEEKTTDIRQPQIDEPQQTQTDEPQQAQTDEPQQAQTDEPQQAESTETSNFSFENLSDRVFYYSSGAGAWYTELFIHSDGTFHGAHMDSDMGDSDDAYPDGTIYYNNFTGSFDHLEKIDDFTYQMKMTSLIPEQEPETEEIIDGVRYIYSDVYGLDGGDDFYLYLPGAELAGLPEDYRKWVGYNSLENTEETALPFYGLYNVSMAAGFSSYVYEEQSLSERIALEISFAEERATELEEELQSVTTQLDMNMITDELFQTWDDTLNIVWKLLAAELDDSVMESLKIEEKNWIDFKDAEVASAGQEFEGGSMQPMVQTMKAAELTKERVYELAKYAE